MSNTYLILIMLIAWLGCTKNQASFLGAYELEITGIKNAATGELEIVGEPSDYFGKITINAKRKRVYAIGLQYHESDSLHFILPGKGGFLSMKKGVTEWKGRFKYFGLQADIIAKKVSDASQEMQALVGLKPIGVGVISTNQEESFPSFDPINKILYFSREQGIYASSQEGSHWQAPSILPFSGDFFDSAPYIFNQGKSLLFTSDRPIDSLAPKKKNLWWVNKTKDAWSDPRPLPYPVNIDTLGDYHGAALDSTHIYFISYDRESGFGRSDIFVGTRNSNDQYEVTNLGEIINTENSEADIYVDPGQRYLLFAATDRAGSFGADDIYISFKEREQWSKPINLGAKVNSFAYEYGAWVDTIHGDLYFNSFRRGTSDIYRIGLSELDVFK